MQQKFFTLEELKRFDGKAGKLAYLAFKEKVYDVSHSNLCKDGDHQESHSAGNDLTAELESAPHGEEVFKEFSVVGELHESPANSLNISEKT